MKGVKRLRHDSTTQFMPLSNGKLFKDCENEVDYEYDWGFGKSKESDKVKDNDVLLKSQINQNDQNTSDGTRNKFTYIGEDPLKMRLDDQTMYLTNLEDIYNRNMVYIPSFCEIEGLRDNINKIISQEISNAFKIDAGKTRSDLTKIWLLLKEKYVDTGRLAPVSVASRLIVNACTNLKAAETLFEKCSDDFKCHALEFVNFMKVWKADSHTSTGVELVLQNFLTVAGKILLRFQDNLDVSLESMAQYSFNRDSFLRMVRGDTQQLKESLKQQETQIKNNKIESDDNDDDDEDDIAESEERSASQKLMDNRSLVPRRKNDIARVKHRKKFKKALGVIRSKAAPMRTETPIGYTGERSGIKTGLIRSRKL